MNRLKQILAWLLLTAPQAFAQEETAAAASSGLTGLGWAFMICSITGVWALAIFCYKKLLFED